MTPLAPTVAALVEKHFAPGARAEVSRLLAEYAGPERERVQTGIVTLAVRDKKQVGELVECAQRDYRDILFWAEYPEESRLDTPEKRGQVLELFRRLGVEPPPELEEGGKS